MLVSIVVPVYNSSKYLARCLDSILMQTFRDYEVIVVDDGSTDSSASICDAYAEKYKMIKVIHQNNAGVSAARNKGIDESRGKYLMFVDSDDYIDTNMLDVAVSKIEEYDADIFMSGNIEEYVSNGIITNSVKRTVTSSCLYSLRKFLENFGQAYPVVCLSNSWCKLYKMENIKKNEIQFDESMSIDEDTNFIFSYMNYVQKIYFSKEILYHYYRDNRETLSVKFHADRYEIIEYVYGKMMNLMYRENCSAESFSRFENMYFLYMVGCIIKYYINSDKCSKKDRIGQIKKVINNQVIHSTKMRNIRGLKGKLIFLVMKIKMICILNLLFNLVYKKRNSYV